MKKRISAKLISIFAALCLILPLTMVRADAAININGGEVAETSLIDDLRDMFLQYPADTTLNITGDTEEIGLAEITFSQDNQAVNWTASAPRIALEVISNTYNGDDSGFADTSTFAMSGGSLNELTLNSFYDSYGTINGTAEIGTLTVLGGSAIINIGGTAHIGTLNLSTGFQSVTIGADVIIDNPVTVPDGYTITDNRPQSNNIIPDVEDVTLVLTPNMQGDDLRSAIETAFYESMGATLTISGENQSDEEISFSLAPGRNIIWTANTQGLDIYIHSDTSISDSSAGGNFTMTGGVVNSITADPALAGLISITGGVVTQPFDTSIITDKRPVPSPSENPKTETVSDTGLKASAPSDSSSPSTQPSNPTPKPEPETLPPAPGNNYTLTGITPGGGTDGGTTELTVTVESTEPVIVGGQSYSGTVDVQDYYSKTPQPIPTEVYINGERFLVGDTIYIVSEKNFEIVDYAETGVSYVFPAVENTADPVTYTATGLPEGVVLSGDGVLSTEKLPLAAGSYTIEVTANNGKDTHTINATIVIKEGYAADSDLVADITKNDKENEPTVLDDSEERGDSEGVLNLWMNGELKLHYDPELADFAGLFLDGKKLIEETDYTLEEGSTVVVLTEQTMVPLTNGDHVVTTMFSQNSNVGMDTVINDVGSSSFVFRVGDKAAGSKRVNISGDGVKGSVMFDGEDEETPITTLSANTEAIEKRCENLTNATGNEIIAAFETKQSGGFGGKTATFAVSTRSLGLTLKNGSDIYIAVYDPKTNKTYQNKGTVKDGMIIFKTKYSGVFMISREKF
ncbi:MAG: hypothetical protein LBL87_05305 [Ruminococcus sp.]|jgi:hypothetical protein|nr:hypothetical protein [Ruminococcus sp.]